MSHHQLAANTTLTQLIAPDPQAYPGRTTTLSEELTALHDRLLLSVPCVARIACALYDPGEDRLKTFINSTRQGRAIAGYEFRLADSPSLSQLAKSGELRVLHDIPAILSGGSAHSAWLLEQGYRSSLTIPMYAHNRDLLGFIFFDAMEPHAFTPAVQRDLLLYSSLITLAIQNELAAIRSIIASTRLAQDLTLFRDFETGDHLERVSRYARLIAKSVAPGRGLGDDFIEHVYLFAPLHDVGKIAISDSILLKQGRLDAEERRIMETHVERGLEIIEKIIGGFDLAHLPDSRVMRNIVAAHHEYLDGSGYPKGLVGEQIPLEARIVTVADIFDALTCRRPYKQPWTFTAALEELERMVLAGKLDGDCVAALRREEVEAAAIHARYQETSPHSAGSG